MYVGYFIYDASKDLARLYIIWVKLKMDFFDEVPQEKVDTTSGGSDKHARIAVSFAKDLQSDTDTTASSDIFLDISSAIYKNSNRNSSNCTITDDSLPAMNGDHAVDALFSAFYDNDFENSLFNDLSSYVHDLELLSIMGYKLTNQEGTLPSLDTGDNDWWVRMSDGEMVVASSSRSGLPLGPNLPIS